MHCYRRTAALFLCIVSWVAKGSLGFSGPKPEPKAANIPSTSSSTNPSRDPSKKRDEWQENPLRTPTFTKSLSIEGAITAKRGQPRESARPVVSAVGQEAVRHLTCWNTFTRKGAILMIIQLIVATVHFIALRGR